jgi:hypothetical protein
MDNNQKNFLISKRQFIRIIQSDITNHYEVIKKIGEGSYGKIYIIKALFKILKFISTKNIFIFINIIRFKFSLKI